MQSLKILATIVNEIARVMQNLSKTLERKI